ncbi:GNAT family N-acetyltransferase [Actinocorallia sp. API 0066]|uniref:bifunctional acetate--CoA ligase family protein/GNAT family N-acetyltransferase n=1 Tax=Actinocorallia sp. API 0066 TaxID=2896846 RepID=UPI001E3D8DAD|nr:GNAT family N-acetyltransferase [Actinocorallia sp. API 0066]MCD0451865.1 GNAT family N-acetyltransferase [Actinocorallia sp. API 0066]
MTDHPYPDHWEADVVLSDGGTAHLRPIRAGDAELLRAFYSRVSAESIYYRFFSPRPHLSDKEIRHFTTVDYSDRVALIATIGQQMVGVVRYDRTKDPGQAEVAFLVEDAHQGRGIGSVLLEHLAAAARERGVARFEANVLPDNRKMSKVFKEAGYAAVQRFEDGIIQLTLDLSPTETSREVMAAREHRAESRSIERLLHPSSVAVIGASRVSHSVGQTVLRNLLGADFTGPVYPVHPEAHAVAGVRAYKEIAEIPDKVDLAVVAVPASAVQDVLTQCAAQGVHGLIVVSSGFAETGQEGRAAQQELVRVARANGMRVVGPNCLGISNTDPSVRLNATLAPVTPARGPVGFFSQSGALGIAILQRTAERGLGLSTFVSAGNRADVSGNDLLQYWEADPSTNAVMLHLESIGNPRKFTRLARRVSRSKPIVAVKTGRSLQGVPLGHAVRRIDLPDHAVSALFEQAGVLRVEDLGEMFDVAQLLAYQPLPAGRRVAIIDNADSLGLLARDAAAVHGLVAGPLASLGPRADADDYARALTAALEDPAVDAVVVLYTPPVLGGAQLMLSGRRRAEPVAETIARLARGSDKPVVATYLGQKGMPRALRAPTPGGEPGPGSVPSYPAPDDAVRALSYAYRYAAWRRRPQGRIPDLDGIDKERARGLVEGWLAEGERGDAAELLACYGVRVGGGRGGIAVHIATQEDASFGAVVSFRLADVAAALLDDRAYRLAPLTELEAADMVRAIRMAPLLFGHQGSEKVAVEALEELLIRVALLANDLPEVARLELEPVMADADGVTVTAARISLAPPPGPRQALEPRRM